MQISITKLESQNFTLFNIGKFAELDQYIFNPSGFKIGFPGKLFLKEIMQLTGMEVSLNKLKAGLSTPFSHKHKENEELYIFLKGQGKFQVDNEILNVQEGSIIRVDPAGARAISNVSDEDLDYIVIQAKAGSLTSKDISDGMKAD